MRSTAASMVLRILTATCVVAGLLSPIAARAEEPPPPITPQITGPHDDCPLAVDEGGVDEVVTVSGNAPTGSTVISALLRQFRADGSALLADRDVTSSVSVVGDAFEGSFGLQALEHAATDIALVMTVDTPTHAGVQAISNPISIDRVAPVIRSVKTISSSQIQVRFSESVKTSSNDSSLDWSIRGDQTQRPISVTGNQDSRVLTFSASTFSADEEPSVRYFPPITRDVYRDCVNHDLEGTFTNIAGDGIPPLDPLIEKINDGDATDDRHAGIDESPRFLISGLSPGYTGELWRESGESPGRDDGDIAIGGPVAETAGAVEITSPSLPSDGEFTFYARASDPSGNRSAGEELAVYRFDRLPPNPAGARTNNTSVTVLFDEPIVAGQNNALDWEIDVGGVMVHPTAVTGTGTVRVLDVAGIPNGAELSYTRPPEDGYVDEAGNALASFSSITTEGLLPDSIDVEPETASNNVGVDHSVTLRVLDDAGADVPGADASLRAVAGPNATHDVDGDPETPAGVVGQCLTGTDGTCTVTYTSPEVGRDELQGWIGTFDQAPIGSEPLDGTEMKDQDLVEAEWIIEGAELVLDAQPEFQTGPIDAPHVVTLEVEAVDNETDVAVPVRNVNVDARVLEGPNTGHVGECFTDSDGFCSIAYNSEGTGTDLIQFWIDSVDDDAVGDDELFLDRDEAVDADTDPIVSGTRFNDPAQDVTRRSWSGVVVPILQVEPEDSQGALGTTRTIRFVTTDSLLNAIAGLNVDARVVSGPNAGTHLGECTTSSLGDCFVHSYTSTTTGTDVIQGWIDKDDDDIADEATQFEARAETPEQDEPDQDVIHASWTSGTSGGGTGGGGTGGGGTGGGTGGGGTGGGTGGGGTGGGSTGEGSTGGGSTGSGDGGTVAARSVTLQASVPRIRLGERVRLSGTVQSSDACIPDSVEILRSRAGGTFAVLKAVEVDDAGAWSSMLRPRKSAIYRARIPRNDACDAASSGEAQVGVRARVRGLALDPRIANGTCGVIKGRVTPNKSQQLVRLRRRTARGWKKIVSDRLNDRSRFRFRVCPRAGSHRYRVHWSGDDLNLAAKSTAIALRVVR